MQENGIVKGVKSGSRCGTGCCVQAEKVADGVLVTSTIEGNNGAVTFTSAEWDAFLGQVKAGEWDHTYSASAALVA